MSEDSRFSAILREGKPIVIDGGLATQCEAMGCNIDGELWSAQLIQSNPRALVDASRAFLDAGARIIATASYQASRLGFSKAGLSPQEADESILRSVELAIQARDEFMADHPGTDPPMVAASVGPYAAAMHDGSEYTGAYDTSARSLREFHESRLALLDTSGADLLACETIPSYMEAQVLAELLREVRSPAWVSFCCRDERHISDGKPLREAALLFRGHPQVLAVGVNCTPPQYVSQLIRVLRDAIPEQAIVVYPNSGETFRSTDNSWAGSTTGIDTSAVNEWIEAGAQLVGGCCRVGPAQIRSMAASI